MGNKLGGLTKLLSKKPQKSQNLLNDFNIEKIMSNSNNNNTVPSNSSSNSDSLSSSLSGELTFEEKSRELFEKLKSFNNFIEKNQQIKAVKNNKVNTLNAVKLQKLYNFFLKGFAYSVNQNQNININNLEKKRHEIIIIIKTLILELQKTIAEKFKIQLFRSISENNLNQLKVYISRILKNNEKFNYQSTSNTNLFKPSLQNKNIVHYLLYELQKEENTLLEYASSQTSKNIYNFLRRLYLELPYKILLEYFNQNNKAMNYSFSEVKTLLSEGYIIIPQNMERLILNAFTNDKFKLLKYLIEIKFEITNLLQYPQSNQINYNRKNNKTRNIRNFMQILKQNNSQKYTRFIIFLKNIKQIRETNLNKVIFLNNE